jgi:hypothetical protein
MQPTERQQPLPTRLAQVRELRPLQTQTIMANLSEKFAARYYGTNFV